VAVAALLVYVAARDGGEPAGRPVVVAARDLAPGTRLVAADLAVAHVAGGDLAVAERPDALVGGVLLGPVQAGELVQPGLVAAGAAAPAGYEVALTLPPERVVAARLQPGDRVDVLATGGQGAAARTDVVVRGALVQGRSGGSGGGLGADGVVVVLGVQQPAEVLAVAHALRAAEVTLVRATGAPAAPDAPASWPPAPGAGAPA
jgi:Flp pilus assembly protein CpaB